MTVGKLHDFLRTSQQTKVAPQVVDAFAEGAPPDGFDRCLGAPSILAAGLAPDVVPIVPVVGQLYRYGAVYGQRLDGRFRYAGQH